MRHDWVEPMFRYLEIRFIGTVGAENKPKRPRLLMHGRARRSDATQFSPFDGFFPKLLSPLSSSDAFPILDEKHGARSIGGTFIGTH